VRTLSRVIVASVLVGVLACGKFLAAENGTVGPGGGDGGARDGDVLDAIVIDGEGPDGATGDAGSLRKCSTSAPFSAPTSATTSVSADLRSIRRREDMFFLAHNGPSTDGIDLGGANALPDGGFGPELPWFGTVNDEGGETIPAPSADGLLVLYQDNEKTVLQKTTRSSKTAAFGNPTDYPIVGGTVDGTPTEPYINGLNELYFSTSTDKIYLATMASANATFQRQVSEIGTPSSFPVVSDDGLEIFFMRLESVQSVYHATRAKTSDPFGAPAVDTDLTTNTKNTRPMWLSPDGCTMYVVRTGNTDNNPPLAFHIARRN
jgi:hypothetical protein